MTVLEINPYVRFARRREQKFLPGESVARDHRLFIVEKGSAWFYLDGQAYKLEKGDVIYWHAGVPYRVEAEPDTVISGCNFDFLWRAQTVLLPVSPAKATQQTEPVLEQADFSDTDMFQKVCVLHNTYGILSKLHELYEEYESKQIFYEQRCSALLKDVLVLCLRFYNGNQASSAAKITQEVLAYIKQHYPEDLTNEHFAKVFHYHPNHISQLIKGQTGHPLHRYIRIYRIYTALDLLQSTELSVAEIAEQVGIGDIHQFSKSFKQIIGTPPSSFRK